MRTYAFSMRTAKEVLRDPMTPAFGLGFPLILLILMSVMQRNLPVAIFEIKSLAPGMTVFGLSFMTIFSGMLVSKDRSGAFLMRLYTTPMRDIDYILGYTLPLLPIALLQCAVTYAVALCLGLPVTVNLLAAVPGILPMSVFYIALGLFFGSFMNEKQVGGVCGALMTNLTAWLSGIWIDMSLLGDVFTRIADCLPFVHAVNLERALYAGTYDGVGKDVLIVSAYAVAILIAAVMVFMHKRKRM
mgnify:CR=1 FL=1